ncbi:MAG: SPFH domain-containing protein [Candidatus Methanoplasma sp.]|nr:SPFH domain-containing protein [Candidatus Methanoplasma sp.]
MADQWREFFYCEALPADVLAVRGRRKASGRSSNKGGEENIISDGSVVSVADGQCMLVVEQGKILDVCLEPGEYVFDGKGEPTLLAGGLGKGALESLKSAWSRFKFGGIPGKDTRVYYINTKESLGNKYGTASPVPFRVVDRNIGLDVDISVRCFGEYSFRISNPVLFYANVCGNFGERYLRSEIEGQLKAELLTALQPAFARISGMGVRYSALPGHASEMADALNEVLSAKWRDMRGLEIASFGVSSVSASKEDEERIKELQMRAVMRDPSMQAATLVGAQAEAWKAAAGNENGAMMGFLGFGMAQQAMGGARIDAAYNGQAGQPPNQYATSPGGGFGGARPAPAGWACPCGHAGNSGRFCEECGKPQPPADGWACACGAANKGKFCSECGRPKPAGAPQYRCDKCGWEPADRSKPPRFCPECGDPFDGGDASK